MARRSPEARDPRQGERTRPRSVRPIPPISSADPPRDTARRRSARYARRLLALGAFAVALFVAYSYVAEPLLDGEELEAAQEDGPAAQPAEPPPRPSTAPRQIPPWAWELFEWHAAPAEERGARPAGAPARVPEWYWDWREWRLAQAGAADADG